MGLLLQNAHFVWVSSAQRGPQASLAAQPFEPLMSSVSNMDCKAWAKWFVVPMHASGHLASQLVAPRNMGWLNETRWSTTAALRFGVEAAVKEFRPSRIDLRWKLTGEASMRIPVSMALGRGLRCFPHGLAGSTPRPSPKRINRSGGAAADTKAQHLG